MTATLDVNLLVYAADETNDRDFRKFDGIAVKNPFDDRFAAGFA